MRNLNIALRSLFKQGRHNVTRIVSLSVGLAVALILIAKICFERSFDSFYPEVERIYRLVEYGSINDGAFEFPQTPGAVAPAMKEEVPGIEAATRLTYVTGEGTRITADKRRYLADYVLMADSCLFDVLPRPVLSGDPKKVLARPGYAMISRSLAERLGGIDRVDGEVLVPDDDPGSRWIVGGVFEDVTMRVCDIFSSIPSVLMAIAVVSALGKSTFNLMLAVGIASTAPFVRVARAAVLTIRGEEYIESARAIGVPEWQIVATHILPNCVSQIIVQATLRVGSAIISAAQLSFLGLGVPAPAPEWGSMLSAGRAYIRDYSYMTLYPGLAIMVTVLSLNLIGDGLRDALDPKLKR